MANKASKLTPRQIVESIVLPDNWQWPGEDFALEAINRRVRFCKGRPVTSDKPATYDIWMDEHTVKYIRGSDLTVMWQDDSTLNTVTPKWVAQLQKRTGKITGEVRDNLIIRVLHGGAIRDLPILPLRWENDKNMNGVLFFGEKEVGRYPMFRASATNAISIMLDTRRKWYQHITDNEARGLAAILDRQMKEENLTMVLAYRCAGQILYNYSTGSGWMKTDVRQRVKYNCNLHWLRREEWNQLISGKEWNPQGVGDSTLKGYIS